MARIWGIVRLVFALFMMPVTAVAGMFKTGPESTTSWAAGGTSSVGPPVRDVTAEVFSEHEIQRLAAALENGDVDPAHRHNIVRNVRLLNAIDSAKLTEAQQSAFDEVCRQVGSFLSHEPTRKAARMLHDLLEDFFRAMRKQQLPEVDGGATSAGPR